MCAVNHADFLDGTTTVVFDNVDRTHFDLFRRGIEEELKRKVRFILGKRKNLRVLKWIGRDGDPREQRI